MAKKIEGEEMEKYYPSEEQGIDKEETEDKIEEDMDTGEKDEDVYTKEGREKLEEDDEISPEEEGVMEGASGGGSGAKCRRCGKILIGTKFVEKKINGETHRFCSDHCAEEFEPKKL